MASLERMGDLAVNMAERVADLATNVGQDVIFAVTGRIVRHLPLPEAVPGERLLRPTAWLRMTAGPSAAADCP